MPEPIHFHSQYDGKFQQQMLFWHHFIIQQCYWCPKEINKIFDDDCKMVLRKQQHIVLVAC